MSRNRGATPYSCAPIGRPKSLVGRGLDVFFRRRIGGTACSTGGGGATTYGGYYELSWDGRERPSDFRLLRGVFAPTYQVAVPAMVVCTSGRSVVLAMEKSSR